VAQALLLLPLQPLLLQQLRRRLRQRRTCFEATLGDGRSPVKLLTSWLPNG
jgi:hypothetical protein